MSDLGHACITGSSALVRPVGFLSPFVALARIVQRAMAFVIAWEARRRTIRELMALDDRMLSDLGITRGDIASIAAGTHSRTRWMSLRGPMPLSSLEGNSRAA